jgi:hypothetical protein
MDKFRNISRAFFIAVVLLVGAFTLGCQPYLQPPKAERLKEGLPAGHGLAFGRLQAVVGRSLYLLQNESANEVTYQKFDVHLLNQATKKRFTFKTGKDGEFFVVLPAGKYEIAGIWGTGYRVWKKGAEEGWSFTIPAGSATYLGTLSLRGFPPKEILVLDQLSPATQRLQARYPDFATENRPVKGLIKVAGNYGETLRVNRHFLEGPPGRVTFIVVPGR